MNLNRGATSTPALARGSSRQGACIAGAHGSRSAQPAMRDILRVVGWRGHHRGWPHLASLACFAALCVASTTLLFGPINFGLYVAGLAVGVLIIAGTRNTWEIFVGCGAAFANPYFCSSLQGESVRGCISSLSLRCLLSAQRPRGSARPSPWSEDVATRFPKTPYTGS